MSQFTPVGAGHSKPALVSSERKIDYDRGVVIKLISSLGMEVFMYRDDPGVYLSQHGTVVPDELAEMAGFDIQLLGKRRKHKLMVAQATEAYSKQLELGEAKATRKIIAERDGFQVVLVGGVRHAVLDPDGLEINKNMPLTEAVAMELFNKLAPEKAPAGPGDSGGNRAAGGSVRGK